MSHNVGIKSNRYLRIRTFTIEEVLPLVVLDRQPRVQKMPLGSLPQGVKTNAIICEGKVVKMSSKRLRTFATKGLKCATCDLVGQYFALERHLTLSDHSNPDVWHFNLYAIDADGLEVLMTRDHIQPISRGGSDGLENSQTMCSRCNNKKGNKV